MLLEIGIIRLSLIILGVLFALGLLLEAILRIVFGFGNPLIYKADAEIGYLLAPNQQTRRFSNFIAVKNKLFQKTETLFHNKKNFKYLHVFKYLKEIGALSKIMSNLIFHFTVRPLKLLYLYYVLATGS